MATVTELYQAVRDKFGIEIAELLTSYITHLTDLTEIKKEQTELRIDMAQVRSEVSQQRSDLTAELVKLHTEIKLLRMDMEGHVVQLRAEISQVRSELKEEIAQLRAEISQVRSELKEEIAQLRSELKEDIHKAFTQMNNNIIKWLVGFFISMMLMILGLYFTK